jgi:serine protease
MMNRLFVIVLFGCVSIASAWAQQLPFAQGEVLIALKPNADVELLAHRMATFFPEKFFLHKNIAPVQQIWLVKAIDDLEYRALEWLNKQPEVNVAQLNYLLESRNLPNDPQFPNQWHLNNAPGTGLPSTLPIDMNAKEAWNISTGGISPAGDTIVVAMIDSGLDFTHTDLKDNLWVNHAEIPDNNKDEDQNGYIDDYLGWNVSTLNDNIGGLTTTHGTPIAGIIGARGNNNIGVSGVNWRVKMMFVASGGTMADVLAAYDYILHTRRVYNASNGKSGAFVVAVNCSFGTDYGSPTQAPLWCAAFDSLGKHGILSIAATANKAIDVDQVGDLPTSCASDYLITVTNVNKKDVKVQEAAWGKKHIDLGAFGEDIFSTASGSNYGLVRGTSFAAPQVSGAIGLLFSSPCPTLISEMKTDPAEAAYYAKKLLLGSVQPNISLSDKTLSGGRLNLFQLLKNYEESCPSCSAPFAVTVENLKSGEVAFQWVQTQDNDQIRLRIRKDDTQTWIVYDNITQNFVVKGLIPCQTYQYSMQTKCTDQDSSAWTIVRNFQTNGCCTPPDKHTYEVNLTNNSAKIKWVTIDAALGYTIRYRSTDADWSSLHTDVNFIGIENLQACTLYEIQLLTHCNLSKTDFSSSFFIKTTGCGACVEQSYCTSKSNHAEDEWIETVTIGKFTNKSPKSNGYQSFTDHNIFLKPNTLIPVSITPGFTGQPYKEFFRIFLDLNADGDFDDPEELVFDPGFALEGTVNGFISIPNMNQRIVTRLRVSMKFSGSSISKSPEPCEIFGFGEVEDYCVTISPENSSNQYIGHEGALRIYPQPATNYLNIELPEPAQTLLVYNALGQLIYTDDFIGQTTVNIFVENWKSGVYFIEATANGRLYYGKMFIFHN